MNTTLEIPEGSKATIAGKEIDGKYYLVVEVENKSDMIDIEEKARIMLEKTRADLSFAETKKHILEFLEFTKHYTRDVDNKVWYSGYYYSEFSLNTNVMISSDEIAFTDDEMIDYFLKRKMVESKLTEKQ